MTRVIDCCLLHDELSMLELRLHELADVVDVFVVIEARSTFTGHPKPAHLTDALNGGWFMASPKPLAVFIAPLTDGSAWSREHAQRNAIAAALRQVRAEDDDLILVSDVDEIPRAEAVRDVADLPDLRHSTAAFDQTVYFYHPQCHNLLPHWYGTRAVRYGRMESPQSYRATEWLRPDDVVIPDAGWHFSYFMDTDAIRRKVASYSHTEVNRPEYMDEGNLLAAMDECRSFVPGDGQVFEHDFTRDLPQYMLDNGARYGLEPIVPFDFVDWAEQFAAWVGVPA